MRRLLTALTVSLLALQVSANEPGTASSSAPPDPATGAVPTAPIPATNHAHFVGLRSRDCCSRKEES